MQLLIDTDAFCTLAAGNLLNAAANLFGTDISSCARLPALPHMLQRGRLRKRLGNQISDELISTAVSMPALQMPSNSWLDQLAPVSGIDPGEAQIFALAAENGLIVLTGDKRSLRALKGMPGFVDTLAGRIVVPEAILIALCDRLGSPEVAQRVQPVLPLNNTIRVCFSPSNPDPRGALFSYYRDLRSELEPMVLWDPRQGE